MVKGRVTSQRAIEVLKVSDLKESVESTKERSVWIIDGEEFVYVKGDDFLRSRAGLAADWQIWPLDAADKKSAKKKVFKIIQ